MVYLIRSQYLRVEIDYIYRMEHLRCCVTLFKQNIYYLYVQTATCFGQPDSHLLTVHARRSKIYSCNFAMLRPQSSQYFTSTDKFQKYLKVYIYKPVYIITVGGVAVCLVCRNHINSKK